MDYSKSSITKGGKTTYVRPFPISIDFEALNAQSQGKEVECEMARCNLWNVYMRLFTSLRHIEGVYLEDKGYTVSLHYRLVKKKNDADYFVHSPEEVRLFLEYLYKQKGTSNDGRISETE